MRKSWSRRRKKLLLGLLPRRLIVWLRVNIAPVVSFGFLAEWARPSPASRPRKRARKIRPITVLARPSATSQRPTYPVAIAPAGVVPTYNVWPTAWESRLTSSDPPIPLQNQLIDAATQHLVRVVKTDLKKGEYVEAAVAGGIALYLDSLRK
jgi:hypothetical protein